MTRRFFAHPSSHPRPKVSSGTSFANHIFPSTRYLWEVRCCFWTCFCTIRPPGPLTIAPLLRCTLLNRGVRFFPLYLSHRVLTASYLLHLLLQHLAKLTTHLQPKSELDPNGTVPLKAFVSTPSAVSVVISLSPNLSFFVDPG